MVSARLVQLQPAVVRRPRPQKRNGESQPRRLPLVFSTQWGVPGAEAYEFGEKRAVTLVEHQQIVARETNPERRDFYQLAWHLGASQSDIAFLDASNIRLS